MTAALGLPRPARPGWMPLQWGRPLVHPLFDHLLIGGGLSLAVTAILYARRSSGDAGDAAALPALLPLLLLAESSAHFGASTVRLYTTPGAFKERPLLTCALPLVAVLALALALLQPSTFGRDMRALAVTWLPYHYAMQALGLALLYCARGACDLRAGERLLLRLACLAPFAFAFLSAPDAGLRWFVSAEVLARPGLASLHGALVSSAAALSFAAPLVFLLRPAVLGRPALPFISVLVVLSNAVWWTTLVYLDAFVWAALFHGLQYLCVASHLHVRQQRAQGSTRGWRHHVGRFYLACVVLGYLLLQAWPLACVVAGFTFSASVLLVGAVVGIHHFLVDACLWPRYEEAGRDAWP